MDVMKAIRLVPAILIFAAAAYAAGSIQTILPPKNSVRGFSIMPKSLQYGKGDDISEIYDGGYELYTEAGVTEAARQMYQRGGDYVEVTVHTMKSPKAAADFLAYWQKEFKVKATTKGKTSSSFAITKPNAAVYFVTGTYFTTVIAFYAPEKAKKDLAAFQSVVEKRIASAKKESGSRK